MSEVLSQPEALQTHTGDVPNPALARRQASEQARRDLAAAHRLAVWHDMSEGIYNHLTLAVPGADDRFLVPPFGLHWAEVNASTLLEVSYATGQRLSGAGIVQRSAYCIHAPIHQSSPRHAAVFHTHMPYAGAFTRLQDQRLRPLGQTEALLLDKIAYDDAYDGLARDPSEGERLARVLGEKSILFMANHGVLVTGRTVAEAYDRLYSLERACKVQWLALASGQPLKPLSDALVAKAQAQMSGTPLHDAAAAAYKPGYELHFDALKRLLQRKEPDYQD
ncbi:MAG: class II aldolase/adducin family protein [Janthinobacterium lividum]